MEADDQNMESDDDVEEREKNDEESDEEIQPQINHEDIDFNPKDL